MNPLTHFSMSVVLFAGRLEMLFCAHTIHSQFLCSRMFCVYSCTRTFILLLIHKYASSRGRHGSLVLRVLSLMEAIINVAL